MSRRDDDRFRPKVGPPRAQGGVTRSPFAKHVLVKVRQAGSTARSVLPKAARRPGAKLGRGHVAARFAGRSLGSHARRVVIKARLVVFKGGGRRSVRENLTYLERQGAGRGGNRGQLYGADCDHADGGLFAERGENDRHQFRFIVSPEDGEKLDDLRSFTRELMGQMERDLGTRLDWVAVDHWDTDDPHTHVLLRGKDETGHDLVIAREYLSQGMRLRAVEIATQWLGPRTEIEIRQSAQREIHQERWTSLDQTIQREMRHGRVDLGSVPQDEQARFRRSLMIGRLDRLTEMGLATKTVPATWSMTPEAEVTLRAMGERGDIIRTMQRAFSRDREHSIFDPSRVHARVTGRVVATGLADELQERGYLIVDGVDGCAHYVALPPGTGREKFLAGSIVTVRASADARPADRIIDALSQDGVYRTERHLAEARIHERNPEGFVQAHVRRLEALRRAGIVERIDEGVWRVPHDLIERGRDFDAKRAERALIDIRSELPIRQQVRAMGVTWLDRQLVGGAETLAPGGFGAEVRQALGDREKFLVEHKLAEKRGLRTVFVRDLLAALRARDIEAMAGRIEADTGLVHHPVADGQNISGVFTRTVAMTSGKFAMLQEGIGFSLVPWRPFIEQRIGQSMSAVVRGESVSWGLPRGREIGL